MLADLGKALGFKGYTVEIIQGETEIDKHVEKAGKINRGGGAVLLAVEVIPSEKSRVMVAAATEAPKGEGRFLSYHRDIVPLLAGIGQACGLPRRTF